MNRRVRILDYGVGNIHSVARACSSFFDDVAIASTPHDIRAATHLILPGVGAFGTVVDQIRQRKLENSIIDFVQSGAPLLGICVGMQILAERGFEDGLHQGLGFLPGEVRHLAERPFETPCLIPNMGWRSLQLTLQSQTARQKFIISNSSEYYFAHSYEFCPPNDNYITATIDFNSKSIVVAVQKDNIYGIQFHPEKSGKVGLELVRQFLSFI